MTQIIYTSRTPYQAYQRCKRLRWLSTHEGEQQIGLEPKRKSLHLVVGSAVHAGMEVLLREGQDYLDHLTAEVPEYDSLAAQLEFMFVESRGSADGKTVARQIEDAAVAAALEDLRQEFGSGVELDPEEIAAQAAAKQADGTAAPEIDMGGLVPGQSSNTVEQDSPIVISFEGMEPVPASIPPLDGLQYSVDEGRTYSAGQIQRQSGETNEQYLLAELSALTEGMVRAWSRRRWRGVLEQFEVLEVEHEGEWELARWQDEHDLGCHSSACDIDHSHSIHFLSRHDALLLERQTGYLYLQSFKTTGSWDRRKEMDAAVDMQGLSEAVDVERRFGEAWQIIHEMQVEGMNTENVAEFGRVKQLVSPRVAQWLSTLPDPPQILGVRYEYILKGSRKKDKKDAMNPDRYVQESILCRAYKQEGITSDDRRWAWTYDWHDETGKGRRLDYRSWQKAAVWKHVKVADWIDLLDQGKVQEGALNEQGEPLDALAEQFVPVLTVYRNSDEMLDLLEQMEASEIQIAKDVEEVRRAEREEGAGGKRSALNRLFSQSRAACSWPGLCQYRSTPTQPGFCFGGPDPFNDPSVLERFQAREPNHPKEGLVQIT